MREACEGMQTATSGELRRIVPLTRKIQSRAAMHAITIVSIHTLAQGDTFDALTDCSARTR